MSTLSPFLPAYGLRSPLLQSVLATKRPAKIVWRRRGVLLDAISQRLSFKVRDEDGKPVELIAHYTPAAAAQALVVLIHGWEGSHDSNYLYSMAASLHHVGHAVVRLNMRDHGGSHGLNPEMFHSARLQEVLEAVRAAHGLRADLPLFVIGFSLGGNFALRIALHGPQRGLTPKLCIGVSPAINPYSTLKGINQGPKLFKRYFLDKWKRTLSAKEAAWPGRFDFAKQRQIDCFVEITRTFVAEHTAYTSLDDYLAAYTLTPAQLMAAAAPVAILTAEDDSVCPPTDFAGLSVQGAVIAYAATRHGGHCGFIHNWRLESWAEQQVCTLIAAQLSPSAAAVSP